MNVMIQNDKWSFYGRSFIAANFVGKACRIKKVLHSLIENSKWSERWRTYEPRSHAQDAAEIIKHKRTREKAENFVPLSP